MGWVYGEIIDIIVHRKSHMKQHIYNDLNDLKRLAQFVKDKTKQETLTRQRVEPGEEKGVQQRIDEQEMD